ncbi:hypothetical protein [Oscillibacter sp. ER4]|uniref:hypothetical protein n=1 Tax=Oscillibacter sp. ER4 TaxID=1519439 RepID=UPI00051C8CC3|nr:hypothetical protein [Oscillibacter sp. ER4]
MPLPLILGGAAAIAGAVGIGSAVHGGVKMKEANDTMKWAESKHRESITGFETQNKKTTADMDRLGKKELEILDSFQKFSNIFEQIHNRPEFKPYEKENVSIPAYNAEELKQVSVGAGVLLGGLGGAAVGTAGGFAAAGATTAAVMALGTASTGTAIASLSGVAATNATLAALGGGAIAAGGGGIALGTTILGAATLGVGILVGGVIFNVTGSKLSNKADEAFKQAKKEETEVRKICRYMRTLSDAESRFEDALQTVDKIYRRHLEKLGDLVVLSGKTDWNDYSDAEKKLTENTALLVGLLYSMCKVQLVLQSNSATELNRVNEEEINASREAAKNFLADSGLSALV